MQHINSLADISDIMSAMKYLSQMESNKLSQYIQHQKRVMKSIEIATEDLLQFYPELLENSSIEPKSKKHIIVILGSERGFCGNYNEAMYQATLKTLNEISNKNFELKIIAVGYKIHLKFEQHPNLHKLLNGPRLTEDIPKIISSLIESISLLHLAKPLHVHQPIHLSVLHQSDEQIQPILQNVLPAFQDLKTRNTLKRTYVTPPLTHLSNTDLFSSLLDEYLFASLNQAFYAAFMSENSHRVRHMENAIHKLTEKISGYSVKRNELRQEEITEELEVIMLSSTLVEEPDE